MRWWFYPQCKNCENLFDAVHLSWQHFVWRKTVNFQTMYSTQCYTWYWGCAVLLSTDFYLIWIFCVTSFASYLETSTLIARFMGPTWGPSGADRTQVGPMLAPWTLLSGQSCNYVESDCRKCMLGCCLFQTSISWMLLISPSTSAVHKHELFAVTEWLAQSWFHLLPHHLSFITWGLNKMAAILQSFISNIFFNEMFWILIQIPLIFFLKVQLPIK